MPRFFEVKDLARETSQEPKIRGTFTVKNAGTWTMTFDKEAVEDLDRLKEHMPRTKSREDVVYTALEILALAVYRDVAIIGKYEGEAQEISGLWN